MEMLDDLFGPGGFFADKNLDANCKISSGLTYCLIYELGRGGLGVVYRAQRMNTGFPEIKDEVVLKFLLNLDQSKVKELEHEASIAISLSSHDNILKTYGMEKIKTDSLTDKVKKELAGIENPEYLHCMVMELINGPNLRDLHESHMENNKLLPVELTAFIVSKTLDALEYVNKYIIHKDIKPENIMISSHGGVKLCDFGISQGKLSNKSKLAGTLQYMPPEQLKNEKLDTRADIFSLGMVFYELLTGINPFMTTGPALSQILQIGDKQLGLPFGIKENNWMYKKIKGNTSHITKIPAPHLIREEIPEELSDIIAKMIFFKKDSRYKNAIQANVELRKNYLNQLSFVPNENMLDEYLRELSGIEIITDEEKDRNALYLEALKRTMNENPRTFNIDSYTKKGLNFLKKTASKSQAYSLLFGKENN